MLKLIVFSVSIPGARSIGQCIAAHSVIAAGTIFPTADSGRRKVIGIKERAQLSFGSHINESEFSASESCTADTSEIMPDGEREADDCVESLSMRAAPDAISIVYGVKSRGS